MLCPYTNIVFQHLWDCVKQKPKQYLYAILDAARNEKIYPVLAKADVEYRCLYQGNISRTIAEVAPYLVRFHKESNFLKTLIEDIWKDNCGIFLISSGIFKDLMPHFREFIIAKDEKGKSFYFRFYDPRILRPYLPSCNEAELLNIFGPVIYYYLEDEDGKTVIEYYLDNLKLIKRVINS